MGGNRGCWGVLVVWVLRKGLGRDEKQWEEVAKLNLPRALGRMDPERSR